MSSLKRLLNEDVGDVSEQTSHAEGSRKELCQHDSGQNDVPVLANQSWEGLYNGLIISNFKDGGHSPHFDSGESSFPLLSGVEEGIEAWAAQTMSSSSNEPSDYQPIPVEISSAQSSLNISGITCYGMIYRAAVKVVGNMLNHDEKLSRGQRSIAKDYCTFILRRSTTELSLRFQDDTEFGLLNIHTSKALEELIDRPSIHFEALGSTLTIRETIGKATKSADPVIHVNINLYGREDASKEVGGHLSIHKVYLQRPDKPRLGSIYNNPHVLKFDDMSISSLEYHSEVGSQHVAAVHDAEQFQKTISDVYASLTRGMKLNQLTGDHRVGTPLLPHQQEALDFMMQRENGHVTPEFCLWKPMEGENEGWYCHSVTKARTRTHDPETGGGILADEMGMGKSLSILALVTKTLESAKVWINKQTTDSRGSNNPRKGLSRATLVIVPSAILINEWLNEINIHLDGTLKTLKYHGQKRKELVSTIEEADIILTTYHTLVSDFKDKSSPLHEIEWFRVVLDEAHIIRRQVTTFYRAVSELKARSRWCLTGTPIQNRIEDIGALFAFIQARPFHNIAMFRRFVTIPYEESEERRTIAIQNLTLLLDSLCLRRSKDLLHLPEPQDRLRMIEFSNQERVQYEQTKRIMNRALRQSVGESYGKSIFGIFQIQLQLRILCNHGTYQHSFSWTKRSLLNEREDAQCLIGGNGQITCSTCRQSMPILGSNNIYRTFEGICAHVLCSECLEESVQDPGNTSDELQQCPLCTISGFPVTATGHRAVARDSNGPYLRPEGHSSKMSALITDIQENLWDTKSIVFSCWTNTLNLIERYLLKAFIPFRRIDGGCPLLRRQEILDDFSRTSEIPVLIMTTGTGAFGLNLTAANRIFIIEPQWNPSVESQAIARAIRMKQKQSVIVTRYMVVGTVEQEMRSQQERKLKIAGIGNSTST